MLAYEITTSPVHQINSTLMSKWCQHIEVPLCNAVQCNAAPPNASPDNPSTGRAIPPSIQGTWNPARLTIKEMLGRKVTVSNTSRPRKLTGAETLGSAKERNVVKMTCKIFLS